MSAAKKRSRSRLPLIIGLVFLAVILFFAFEIFGPNTGVFTKEEYLYIHTGATYEQVLQTLEQDHFIVNARSFDILARQAHYPEHVHPGKYRINRGMSNYNLIRMLHAGRQTPVKLVINKLRTKQEFITLLATSLEADSATLQQMFGNEVYLAQFGLDTNTMMCAVMPDTYDFYWNTTADKAFKKIEKDYARFWNNDRKQQARDKALKPDEIVILASIVDEETTKSDDKPNIASVYLNRLNKGMKLQADPTVKFALGDFAIRRVTGTHTQVSSPYNTYQNKGLPPGPICTPSISSIEAVLEAPETDYLYFCAKPELNGYSNFAATYEEQQKNARLYQQALNDRNIH